MKVNVVAFRQAAQSSNRQTYEKAVDLLLLAVLVRGRCRMTFRLNRVLIGPFGRRSGLEVSCDREDSIHLPALLPAASGYAA